MKNEHSTNPTNQNDDYVKRSQAEMQRRFIDLQFKRSELETIVVIASGSGFS